MRDHDYQIKRKEDFEENSDCLGEEKRRAEKKRKRRFVIQ